MGKRVIIWLSFIAFVGIFLRSIPAWTNVAWGGDLGIYFGIASRILEKNEIYINYDGWGSSYQYFPMLYLLSLSIHLLTKVDLMTVMVKFAPIIGGLTVIIFYLIVQELTRNRKIALLSSAFLAVAPFHVYQTSHAAPLTVGHFFMLLSIFLFIKIRENKKYFPLLFISTILLLLSHHLTTYFYLITVAGMIVWRNFKFRIAKKENIIDISYLVIASTLVFLYWRFVAKPVYFSFMKGGLHLEPWQTIGIYFSLIFTSLVLTNKLKENEKIKQVLSKISAKWCLSFKKVLIGSFIAILFIELPFMFVRIPATSVKINPLVLLLSTPIVAFSSLAIAGAPFLSTIRRGSFLQGWLLVISISLLYSLIVGNTTLYPDRHMEYLMVPMSVSSAFSIIEIGKRIDFSAFRKRFRHISKDAAIFSIIALVVFSNALVVYPARYSFGNLDERFSSPCFSAIEWLKEHTDSNDTIATDLRLSDFIWAYGMHATFDQTNLTWSCENWTDCLNELEGNGNYSKVTYVLIDDIMRDSVVYLDVDLYIHMTNESYEKFSREPFELVYRNATIDKEGREIHWAEVYRVNWSYIEERTSS